MRKLLCRIGIHGWDQSRPVIWIDAWPFHNMTNYEAPTRKCRHCGKEQKWLPGYGGSEIGYWADGEVET